MHKPDKCPICGSEIWLVEYDLLNPNHHEGVSEYACKNALVDKPTCRWRIGRFCGQRLEPKEQEPRYCQGIHPAHL